MKWFENHLQGDKAGAKIPVSNNAYMLASEMAKADPDLQAFIVVTQNQLRAAGAKLDGVTDDLPAFNQVLAAATSSKLTFAGLPVLVFDLPAGSILLSGPIDTGQVHCVVLGQGKNLTTLAMKAGGAGIWRHGTASRPAVGYFEMRNLSLVDLTSGPVGAGVPAVSGRWAPISQGLNCNVTLQDLSLRNWAAGFVFVNLPRGLLATGVDVNGPDYQCQSGSAFAISNTPDSYTTGPGGSVQVIGSFSYSFADCFINGYTWGWNILVSLPLEGLLFNRCRAYNGWGLCNSDASAARNDPQDNSNSYHSLLYSFVDCDWQGQGWALVLRRARLVTVRGGFWIFDALRGDRTSPINDPRRRMIALYGCTEVLIDGIEMAAGSGCTDGFSLVYTDAACAHVLLRNNFVDCYAPNAYAAFEIGALPYANQVFERGTRWLTWAGGAKVLDASGKQSMETVVTSTNVNNDGRGYYGTVSGDGTWTLRGQAGPLTVDSNLRAAVTFPTRPDGSPFFVGGLPVVVFSAINGNGPVPIPSLFQVTSTGFVVAFSNSSGVSNGYVLALDWVAVGL